MADSKVSELTSATSVGGSDLFYIVQTNTSKKVSASTLFANAANVTLKGNINLESAVQLLASPGVIDLTKPVTHLASDASGGTCSIPIGTTNQIKVITMISTSGGTFTISANIANNANVVFNNVGDTATLLYTNSKWHVLGQNTSDTSVTSVNGASGAVTLTTTNINEGTNQYFTNARSRAAISVSGAGTSYNSSTGVITITTGTGNVVTADLTTANVIELNNLYFTNARAITALTNNNITLGNVTLNNLSGKAGNLSILSNAGSHTWILDNYGGLTAPGSLHLPEGDLLSNGDHIHLYGKQDSYVKISSNNASKTWLFNLDGSLVTPGSISTQGLTSVGRTKVEKVLESYASKVDATGVVVHDCSNTHIFNHTSIDSNFTANFTNLGLNSGEATSVTLVLNQGGTAYIANAVQIGGVAQTIKWQANSQPTGNINAVDIQSFSILNVSGNYTVLGQLSTFG